VVYCGAMLLHVLMLPDHERARRIGEFFSGPATQTFGHLPIDLEESTSLAGSRTARASRARVARRVLKVGDAPFAQAKLILIRNRFLEAAPALGLCSESAQARVNPTDHV
jgi:hypothetical protein